MCLVKLLIIVCCMGFSAALAPTNRRCIHIDDCPQVLELIRTRKNHFGTKTLLRSLYCNTQGRQAYIRCIDASAIKNFMDKAELLSDQDRCGVESTRPKIAGGEIVHLDEFPWIALLKYTNIDGNMQYGCHGNLISKKYVLTAAHCVDHSSTDLKRRLLGNVSSVVLGEYDLRNKTDCDETGDLCTQANEYLITSIHMHPKYNSVSKINDIALIRLEGEVEFSDFIKPICLPPNLEISIGKREPLWIGGWGETEKGEFNNVKMKAKFAKKDNCFVTLDITENQLCAGSYNNSNSKTCPGDSGGPLMVQRFIGDNSQTFLIGVTSFGIQCYKDIYTTIFTKVSPYVKWIVETIQK